jgi:excisionase family DNA binding protein
MTVKDVADHYAVTIHTVLSWISSGELLAVNVGRRPGKKPRWRISQAALDRFEQLRTATPPIPRAPRRRRQQEQVFEFYQ